MPFLKSLKLLLPALIPSWNFFDVIAPSPRIQFALLNSANEIPDNWQEFRPRPETLSITQMLKRMLWNPRWNESLFLVSCAERIMGDSTQELIEHSENEILKRIKNDLLQKHKTLTASHLQFRLLFVQRKGAELKEDELKEEIMFLSRIQDLAVNKVA